MDKTNRSFASACNNERVVRVVLVAPADTALDLIAILSDVSSSSHFHSFNQLLLVKLIFRHLELITSEIFYSKPHSTKLNGVKFLDLVVIFTALVLQRSSYKPETVGRLLLLVFCGGGVIKIVTLRVFFE